MKRNFVSNQSCNGDYVLVRSLDRATQVAQSAFQGICSELLACLGDVWAAGKARMFLHVLEHEGNNARECVS